MKMPIIIAIILLVIGFLLALGSLFMVRFDFRSFGAVQYEKREQTVTDSFTDIVIDADTFDVILAPVGEGGVRVEYDEPLKGKISLDVSVKDGKLCVTLKDDRKWYEKWTIFNFHSPTITVYLPEGDYGALDVSLTTGDVLVTKGFSFASATLELTTGDVDFNAAVSGAITATVTTGKLCFSGEAASLTLAGTANDVLLADLTVAGAISVSVTTGDIEIKNGTAAEVALSGTTGDIEVKNLIVSGNVRTKSTTGDVELARVLVGGHLEIKGGSTDVSLVDSDAGTIYVDVTTGSVTGKLLTDKQYLATTTTGSIRVPRTTGPLCEIHTTTGDIDFLGED